MRPSIYILFVVLRRLLFVTEHPGFFEPLVHPNRPQLWERLILPKNYVYKFNQSVKYKGSFIGEFCFLFSLIDYAGSVDLTYHDLIA